MTTKTAAEIWKLYATDRAIGLTAMAKANRLDAGVLLDFAAKWKYNATHPQPLTDARRESLKKVRSFETANALEEIERIAITILAGIAVYNGDATASNMPHGHAPEPADLRFQTVELAKTIVFFAEKLEM